MRLSRCVGPFLGLAALGCHSFQPVALQELRPGMEVRARISASQASELSAYLPSEQDGLVAGTVLDTSPGELLLLIPVTTRNRPGHMETLGQRLAIPSREIFEVEERSLDRAKSALLSVGTAIVTGYVLYRTLGEGSSGSTPGTGGSDPQDSVILWRIPIGP